MPTLVGAVLWRTRPNAICIPNRAFYRTHVIIVEPENM